MTADLGDATTLDNALASAGVESVDELPQVGMHVSRAPTRTYIERSEPTVASLVSLIVAFREELDKAAISFDASTQLDLLASYLSSQFILLAGPSGTGKSTAARALQNFFAPRDAQAVLEGRRQLIGPEDVVGYYTALAQRFVSSPDLHTLIRVGARDERCASPSILVEEMNLSPIEGYLGPFAHGLSKTHSTWISWPLHDAQEADVPPELHFGPYARLIGTINIDATASAPSPKVAARACVVLLEPNDEVNVQQALSDLIASTPTESEAFPGAAMVQDPRAIFRTVTSPSELRPLASAIEQLAEIVMPTSTEVGAPRRNIITRRQLTQMLLYGAWYGRLSAAWMNLAARSFDDESAARWAAGNALLHFVLPSLSPRDFTDALDRLATPDALGAIPAADELGSLLPSRVARLTAAADDSLLTGRVLDFWDRLS